MMAPDRIDWNELDQFGATRAERLKQFLVPGWRPSRGYYARPGAHKSWVVFNPAGHVQDAVSTRREAEKLAVERNTHAAWAYEGGEGPIPYSSIRFPSDKEPRP